MSLFVYILYKTPLNKGVFSSGIDLSDLQKALDVSKTIPSKEFENACLAFQNSIMLIDNGTPAERIFENSLLNADVFAFYLISRSKQVKHLMKTVLSDETGLHFCYEVDATKTQLSISEKVYPGPQAKAPFHVTSVWLDKMGTKN